MVVSGCQLPGTAIAQSVLGLKCCFDGCAELVEQFFAVCFWSAAASEKVVFFMVALLTGLAGGLLSCLQPGSAGPWVGLAAHPFVMGGMCFAS